MPQNNLLKFLIKIKNKGSTKTPINYSASKNIAILYEVNNEAEGKLVNTYIQKLEDERKHVTSIEFLPKKRNEQAVLKEVNHYFFKESELNFLKLPGKKITTKICSRDSEIIINLAKPNNIYMHYLASMCKAKFKISLHHPDYSHLYDFMLTPAPKSSLNDIINSLDGYLRIINKN